MYHYTKVFKPIVYVSVYTNVKKWSARKIELYDQACFYEKYLLMNHNYKYIKRLYKVMVRYICDNVSIILTV